MKPHITKNGCSWIVLRFGHPVYGWCYNRCHDTWREALEYALAVLDYRGERDE